jgi:hypothetical protein
MCVVLIPAKNLIRIENIEDLLNDLKNILED